MTNDQVRRLNAELGFPPASAERWLHDLRADERREQVAVSTAVVGNRALRRAQHSNNRKL